MDKKVVRVDFGGGCLKQVGAKTSEKEKFSSGRRLRRITPLFVPGCFSTRTLRSRHHLARRQHETKTAERRSRRRRSKKWQRKKHTGEELKNKAAKNQLRLNHLTLNIKKGWVGGPFFFTAKQGEAKIRLKPWFFPNFFRKFPWIFPQICPEISLDFFPIFSGNFTPPPVAGKEFKCPLMPQNFSNFG